MSTAPALPGLAADVSRETPVAVERVRGTRADRSRSRLVDGVKLNGWSDHEKALLARLWAQGVPADQIALQLNTTAKAARVMATRLQVKRPKDFRGTR